MRILVTGAAGFIGSHLCERLLADERNEVVGIDAFIDPSLKSIKVRNLRLLLQHSRFDFKEQNVLGADWNKLLSGVDTVYHLAGLPGVRTSWGSQFSEYVLHNITATQQLLEGCKNLSLRKFIYASTSSVYGEKTGKVEESAFPEPLSPYGVSKLTGERLCWVYHRNYGIPAVVLRFFTVYGPRQRPDMAFHRFIHHALTGNPVPVYGDGTQTRDFTFVKDCVEATAAALYASGLIGETINIGGKERASVLDIIAILQQLMGGNIAVDFHEKPFGEPKHTWADITKAENLLQYQPRIGLKAGLAAEIIDLCELYGFQALNLNGLYKLAQGEQS